MDGIRGEFEARWESKRTKAREVQKRGEKALPMIPAETAPKPVAF
jgi:hypothetical protein